MNDFVCETHGPYPNVRPEPSYCCGCLHEKDDATERLQAAYSANQNFHEQWLHRSGVPGRFRRSTTLNWRPQGPVQEAALRVVLAYCGDLGRSVRGGRGITLTGPPGVGKTHLCCAIIAEAFKARIDARYVLWPDVLARTKGAFGDSQSTDRNLIDELKRSPFLALDDPGTRESSNFDQSQLFELVDARYRERLPTLVATNLTEEAIVAIGERTADRLQEMNALVHLPGRSHRRMASRGCSMDGAPLAFPAPALPAATHRVSRDGFPFDKPVAIVSAKSRW